MAQFILKLFKSEKSIFQTLIPIFYHFTSDKKVRFQLHNIKNIKLSEKGKIFLSWREWDKEILD